MPSLQDTVTTAAAAAGTWAASSAATRARLLKGPATALEGTHETLAPLVDRECSLGPYG